MKTITEEQLKEIIIEAYDEGFKAAIDVLKAGAEEVAKNRKSNSTNKSVGEK